MSGWPIYTGSGVPHDGIDNLPAAPNWRAFDGGPPVSNLGVTTKAEHVDPSTARRLGTSGNRRRPLQGEIRMINAALFLRRPLLVTGRPGTGKSTLAYAVAEELKLGPVLRWPITSRSTLQEGLYRYDPIGRLREENLRQLRSGDGSSASEGDDGAAEMTKGIGRHLRLGPLGTALLPYERPRVLLVDEIDKSDIDLPNDLLNVFEEGEYEVDELTRLPDKAVAVMTADPGEPVTIRHGRVRCRAFPFVVLTSNGEREFPPAFLRRCLRLDLQPPDDAQLLAIITAHLGEDAAAAAATQVQAFLTRRERAEVTTDQLLNAVYLATSGSRHAGSAPEEVAALDDVVNAVMQPLNNLDGE